MPLYLEEVVGLGPAATGRWLAILPLVALFLAPVAGRLSDRLGTRPFMTAGLALAAAGLAALAMLGPAPSDLRITLGLLLVGVGLGLFVVTNSSALLGHVPPSQLGAASGMQATMRNLGIAGGSAVTAAVLASRFSAHGGGTLGAGMLPAAGRGAFALASRDLYLALALVALAAIGLAARYGGAPRRSDLATH
jgi:MFS family permease